MQKLEPIIFDKEYSAFNITGDIDEFSTKLILRDYDWMNYTLSAQLPTKKYGNMLIEFEYLGLGFCEMRVKLQQKIYTFSFNTNLFEEHIVKFLQKHIESWNNTFAFDGTEEVVNFYNTVLTAPDTVEKKIKDLTEYNGMFCDNKDCYAYDELTGQCEINGNCHLVIAKTP